MEPLLRCGSACIFSEGPGDKANVEPPLGCVFAFLTLLFYNTIHFQVRIHTPLLHVPSTKR